jgi:hypothetical protein
VPAFVRYFLLVQWNDAATTVDRLARVNLIKEHERSEAEEQAFCSRVWRFYPSTDMNEQHDRWLPVDKIQRPLILIKRSVGLSISRLVQLRTGHVVSVEDVDD